MKKIKSFIFVLFFALVLIISPAIVHREHAMASGLSISYADFSEELQKILSDFSGYKTRIAGSENEKESALYIKNYLKENTSLTAKEDISTSDGIQSFKFMNKYTGIYDNSQNIIFEYKTAEKTDKKVILACNYDAPYKYDVETEEYVSFANDAVNTSTGSVASMLMLAQSLPNLNLAFNMEFVFFGASESDYAGSEFYLNGVSDEEAENILCVINIDEVALGKNIYFYMDEISTNFSKYVSKTCTSFASEIDLVHLNKTSLIDTKLGLGYSHVALDSDNVNFMSRGIATINLFAGEYEDGIILGLSEYKNKGIVSYTENDTLEYIEKNYEKNVIIDNLYKVNSAIETLLKDSKFISSASGTFNQTSWFYTIFANKELVIYLTFVAFVILLIVSMYIYYKLTVKSYYANIETEFLTSVVKIADQIDKNAEDKDVAKVIGQVIANDIKKDKTLKREKKKKK